MIEPLAYRPEERVDLHVHSRFSDGLFSPAEIAEKAASKGLKVIALTDHATVAGVAQMSIAGARHGVHTIPGVELNSAEGDLLGLFVDCHSRGLEDFLALVNAERQERLRQTLFRLASAGHRIDCDALCRYAAPALPTRSHLAGLLVEKGIVDTVDNAFACFLGKNGSAYVPGRPPSLASCIEAIRNAGGVAVEAHPHFHHRSRKTDMTAHCRALARLGAAGIEIPAPVPEKLDGFYQNVSAAAGGFGLLPLAGSNFHGPGRTAAQLGTPSMGADRLKELVDRLPPGSLHADIFKRNAWRWKNLDPEAFARSFDPTTVDLDRMALTRLLDLSPLPSGRPASIAPGIPFVLAGPGAADRGDEICSELESAGAKVTAQTAGDRYPEIAWRLYGMDRGDLARKRKDLLRFNLDCCLYGEGAEKCLVIFFRPPAGISLRRTKQQIRQRLGPVRFYRMVCGKIRDICMTTYVHMPEESEVDRECALLSAMGIAGPAEA